MKKTAFHIIFGFILIFHASAGAQFQWSPPIEINQGQAVDMDIDRLTGHCHIATTNDQYGVIYTETDSAGNIIREELAYEDDIYGAYFGASIAVDNTGHPHLCLRQSYDGGRIINVYYKQLDWADLLLMASNVPEGYMVRLDVDNENRAHMAWGEVTTTDTWGHVHYRRVEYKSRTVFQDFLAFPDLFRNDGGLEIDAAADGSVHLVIGCPNSQHGPVTYYRRDPDAGETLQLVGDIHAASCAGRNGSPDVFSDLSGNVHICHGAQRDSDVGGQPSIRYIRYEGDAEVRNVAATQIGWLQEWNNGDGWGLASLAASDDGVAVIIAFLTKNGGDLYTTISTNGGATWQPRELQASAV